TYTVTDAGALSDTATVSLAVQDPPQITSANSKSIQVLTAGSFSVTTTGFPTPAITETGALPSGIALTDNGNGTATLGGTPASGTQGSYPLTIKAANGVAPDFLQPFTLTITCPTITPARTGGGS